MNFTTKISILKSEYEVSHQSNLVLLGSCFAENMGVKFDYFKFQNCTNPFGILFNPISIEKTIYRALNDESFSEKDIFFHDGFWKCFEVHSDLNTIEKDAFLICLNKILTDFKTQICQASHFFFTLGTAWVYRYLPSNAVVGNCHKVAQNQFKKEILHVETIQNSIQNSISIIRKANPNCKFVFTISPVRHLKDGFIENQISKAHLTCAVHQLQLDGCSYFPSYEIMMDELRDYRFYAKDMLHPSETAIDYIWKRFTETYFAAETIGINTEIDVIQKALLHRSNNENSEIHLKFLKILAVKIDQFTTRNPEIKW